MIKNLIAYLCINFVMISSHYATAQGQNPVDSLLNLLKSAKQDSVRARIYSQLTEVCEINEISTYAQEVIAISSKYEKETDVKNKNKFLSYKATAINNLAFVADADGDVDKCIQLYKDALLIREQIRDTNAIGNTLYNLAVLYKNTGKVDEAMTLNQKALFCLTQKKNKLGMANCNFSIGEIYLTRGKIKEAIEYLERSLKLHQEINNKSGIASALTGLGTIQGELGDTKKELEYLKECLKVQEEIGDSFGLAFTYNNLGYVYFTASDFENAKNSYEKSLRYAESINEWTSIALAYHNIGNVYYELNDKKAAGEFYKKSIAIRDKVKDEGGKSSTLINLGKIAYYKGDLAEGKRYLEEAYQIGKKLQYSDAIRKSAEILSALYATEGNYKSAYSMQLEFKQLSDSLYNKENKKASYKQQVKLEFEKKDAEAKIIAKAEKEKLETQNNEEKRRQRIIIYAISGGLILVFLLALLIYKGYRQKQKANLLLEDKNILIEFQKEIVEEKQKEILDSIHYAKRIQNTLLAHHEFVDENIPNNFVLFSPKDIVSGDFYWATKHGSKFYLAVCDSTGHGVPGAFMSLLNIGFLSEAINEKNILEPHQILEHVRGRLVNSVSKEGQQDGFDGILMCFDQSTRGITYAAAHNAPILISNGLITELEKDKMPVGIGERKEAFNLYSIQMNKGDTLYLYTDGYADQFGGPKGKKFKYKPLNELLLNNSTLPLKVQSEKLLHEFEHWKGRLEQVDDVCIIGIRF